MENSKDNIVKPSAKDPFDLELLIKGLIYQLIEMSSNTYEYTYYFTFKRSMKSYADHFNDAFEMPVDDQQFFLNTGDEVVINCCRVDKILIKLERALALSFGLELDQVAEDVDAETQSLRFAPLRMMYKHSKSYKKLKMFYERSVQDYIAYLYKICCVLTTRKYRIPSVFYKQFAKNESPFWLLNAEDKTIMLLTQAITSLKFELQLLRDLATTKKVKSEKRLQLQTSFDDKYYRIINTSTDRITCTEDERLYVSLVTLQEAASHLKAIINKFVQKDPQLRDPVKSGGKCRDEQINEIKDPLITMLRFMYSSIEEPMRSINNVYGIDPKECFFEPEVFDMAADLYWSLIMCNIPTDDCAEENRYDDKFYEEGLQTYIMSLRTIAVHLLHLLDTGVVDMKQAQKNHGILEDINQDEFSGKPHVIAMNLIYEFTLNLKWFHKKFLSKDYNLKDAPRL